MWNLKRYFFIYFFLSIYLSLFFYPNTSKSQNFWEQIYVPDTLGIQSIVVDSNNTIYLGTGSNEYGYTGVYKSFDTGNTWENAGLVGHAVFSLASGNNETIYAGTNKALCKTSDGGETWDTLLFHDFISIGYILPYNEDTIFPCNWNYLPRTFDGGETWDTAIYFGNQGNVMINKIVKNSNDELFITVIDYLFEELDGVYKSTDWGDSWEQVLNEHVISIAINSEDVLFVTSWIDGIFYSYDNGDTWESNHFGTYDIYSIEINSLDHIYVTGNNGVFVSYDDGQNWEELDEGLNSIPEYLYLDPFEFIYCFLDQIAPYNLYRSINATVDIKDQFSEDQTSFVIFPNPLGKNQPLKIINNGEKIFIEEIDLFNVNGSLVFSDNIKTFIQPNNKLEINFPDLHKGLYFIQIKSRNKTYMIKLLSI